MVSQLISTQTLRTKTLKQTRTFYIRQVFKYIKVDFSFNTVNQQAVWTRSVVKCGQLFPAQQILRERPQTMNQVCVCWAVWYQAGASEISYWCPKKT